MHTESVSLKELTDIVVRQLVLDLAKRVTKLEEAAKAPEQQPKTPPTLIAKVGEVWVNRNDLYDYTITAVEVIEDLIIYTTSSRNFDSLRINQVQLASNWVKRSAAPATDSIAKRKAQVAAKRLREICNTMDAHNLVLNVREIREKTIPLLETIE